MNILHVSVGGQYSHVDVSMCVCIYCYLLSAFRLLLSVRLLNDKQFVFGCGRPYWRTASDNPNNNNKPYPS